MQAFAGCMWSSAFSLDIEWASESSQSPSLIRHRFYRDSDWLTKAAAALAAGPTADESSQETLAAIGRALIWPLEALAQRHKAHELLYNVCELLLTAGLMDRQRLLGWMQQEVQETHGAVPADSFTYYVMER